jgi:8-oxo-dGTP pyrophosphatase MutT (NUDIX family)
MMAKPLWITYLPSSPKKLVDELMAVEPEDAATVVLLREIEKDGGDAEIEVYMTKRHHHLNFVGGFYVFPGGKMDRQDLEPKNLKRCKGLGPEDAQRILVDSPDPSKSLAYWVTAIRELFEEAGILLAYNKEGKPINFEAEELREKFFSYRRLIHGGKFTMGEMMVEEELFYAVDKLRYLSRWITPEFSPRRFDTRFFIARLPEKQNPQHYKDEVAESDWTEPTLALSRWEMGDMNMIIPTLATLQDLAKFNSLTELFNAYKPRNIPLPKYSPL